MVQQDWGVQLGIEKIFKNSLSGKILFSDLQGEISGFSTQDGDLDMVHRMVSSALMEAYHSKQKITRVSVGPALHFFSMEGHRLYICTDPVKKTYTKIGLAVETGFRFPANSRFFFDYNSRFFWVGTEDLGSYIFEEPASNGQPYSYTFLAGKNSFNYVTFNFGLGVRFGKLKNNK